jgi:hypothetical protein
MSHPINISYDYLPYNRRLVDAQNNTAKYVWRKIQKTKAFLIADKVGAGKSYVALSVAFGLLQEQKNPRIPFRILILAGPSELSRAWLDKLVGCDDSSSERNILSNLVRRPGKKSYQEMYLKDALHNSTPDTFVYSLRYKNDARLLKEALKASPTTDDALQPRIRSAKRRVEILVTSPRWITTLRKNGPTRNWLNWCRNTDVIIADEIFSAKNPNTHYGKLLRHNAGLSPNLWVHRQSRPWLLGLSATVLARDVSDLLNLLTLCGNWKSPASSRDNALLKTTIGALSKNLLYGIGKSNAEQQSAKLNYRKAKLALEKYCRSYMVRTPPIHARKYNFGATDFSESDHNARESVNDVPPLKEWPARTGIAQILEPIQNQISSAADGIDSDRTVNAFSWLISAAKSDPKVMQRTRFVESYPISYRPPADTPHPKLKALSKWIRHFYREAEEGWLDGTKGEYRFKLLIYVKHVETARSLNPSGHQDRFNKNVGRALQKELERCISSTIKKIAVRNRDLFIDGRLTTPCEALQKHITSLGWDSFSKLTQQNRTLALASLINAHHGGSTRGKLQNFRKTLMDRSTRDPVYEQYTRVLSRYPALRYKVLTKLHAGALVSYEKFLRGKGQKNSPTLIVLDPKRIGLELVAAEIKETLQSAVITDAFRELDKTVIRKKAAPLRASLRIAQETMIKLIEDQPHWLARIKRSSRAPKQALRQFARLSKKQSHRTPGVISVQTGDDAGTRDYAMAAFRSLGNPLILILTNVGTIGVDLHTYCWDVLHYTPAWTPHEAEQKTGRIDRPRLKGEIERLQLGAVRMAQHIRVHYLIWPFTFDERILARLNVRTILADRLLGSRKAKILEENEAQTVKRIGGYRPLDLGPSDG